ncbi:MAG TPA: hypothetical protein VNO31_52825 [Umezawaea sp.]|nr:hypothetical protein [Umezawaea sp.]
MVGLSVDYEAIVRDLAKPLSAEVVGSALFDAMAQRYERRYPACSLVLFEQFGASYLYDLASAVGEGNEDRTVAAWTVTPAVIDKRDTAYPVEIETGLLRAETLHVERFRNRSARS